MTSASLWTARRQWRSELRGCCGAHSLACSDRHVVNCKACLVYGVLACLVPAVYARNLTCPQFFMSGMAQKPEGHLIFALPYPTLPRF